MTDGNPINYEYVFNNIITEYCPVDGKEISISNPISLHFKEDFQINFCCENCALRFIRNPYTFIDYKKTKFTIK